MPSLLFGRLDAGPRGGETGVIYGFVNVLFLTLALLAGGEQQPPPPGPFVTVYRDDAVAFQVRRDRITLLKDGTWKVWLRWLYAEPQPWKSSAETSRIVVADVDCKQLRVRELAVLHRDREGKLFDVEEFPEEQWKWRSFEESSGAAATMTRLCEFLPELLERRKKQE